MKPTREQSAEPGVVPVDVPGTRPGVVSVAEMAGARLHVVATETGETNTTRMPASLDPDVVWAALVQYSAAAVYVVDSSFVHVYVNERGASVVGLKAHEMIGQPMGGHVSDALTEAVKAIMRRVMETGETIIRRSLYQGRLLQSSFVPIRSASGVVDQVLVISHSGCDQSPSDEFAASQMMEPASRSEALGPLARLTKRELEVLKHIGDGCRSVDIAEILGLSTRTVHNHCGSISKKLGKTNRGEMAQLAIRAGLSPQAGRGGRANGVTDESLGGQPPTTFNGTTPNGSTPNGTTP